MIEPLRAKNRAMWVSRQVTAQGQPPTPEQLEQWRRRMSPPENEFPASTGQVVMLGQTDHAAVAITHVEVFSTGFRFTLAVRLREAPPELAHGGLFMLIGSPARPGAEIPLQDRLLLGIEYPDGRRASNLQDLRMAGPGVGAADSNDLVFVQQGGGGGERAVDQTYWVAPLPPDGPVAVVLAWPGFGMPESRTILDGSAIHAAAAGSRLLWPPQPAAEPAQPRPGARPSVGWFAQPPG